MQNLSLLILLLIVCSCNKKQNSNTIIKPELSGKYIFEDQNNSFFCYLSLKENGDASFLKEEEKAVLDSLNGEISYITTTTEFKRLKWQNEIITQEVSSDGEVQPIAEFKYDMNGKARLHLLYEKSESLTTTGEKVLDVIYTNNRWFEVWQGKEEDFLKPYKFEDCDDYKSFELLKKNDESIQMVTINMHYELIPEKLKSQTTTRTYRRLNDTTIVYENLKFSGSKLINNHEEIMGTFVQTGANNYGLLLNGPWGKRVKLDTGPIDKALTDESKVFFLIQRSFPSQNDDPFTSPMPCD